MMHRKNKDLHVVDSQMDPTDLIVEQILDELRNEDGEQTDVEEEIRQYKKKKRTKLLLCMLAVAVVAIALFLFINLQTYTEARVSDTYSIKGAANSSYVQYAKGVLKHSRDGIAYLNKKGEEQWNQSYQIKNPFVVVGEKVAAVADKGGNDIMVFYEDGLKGEIHTTLPIEKIHISEQGIVGAILKDDTSAKIMCYDTAGNVLVEHKASLSGTGYPLDLSMSENGEVMQVLYLCMQQGKVTSKVVYYNFGEAGADKTDHQVTYQEYEDTVMASGFYIDASVSVVVGDNRMVIYQGTDVPEEKTEITLDKEIRSVFHNEKYIGLILKNEGKEGYELRLYNKTGKVALSQDFTGEYNNVKICGDQVIMYDGKKCSIFMRSGIQKYDGEMDNNILEIFPIEGVNKYIVMSASGMENVRLVK